VWNLSSKCWGPGCSGSQPLSRRVGHRGRWLAWDVLSGHDGWILVLELSAHVEQFSTQWIMCDEVGRQMGPWALEQTWRPSYPSSGHYSRRWLIRNTSPRSRPCSQGCSPKLPQRWPKSNPGGCDHATTRPAATRLAVGNRELPRPAVGRHHHHCRPCSSSRLAVRLDLTQIEGT
jgi:hypothetical protein